MERDRKNAHKHIRGTGLRHESQYGGALSEALDLLDRMTVRVIDGERRLD